MTHHRHDKIVTMINDNQQTEIYITKNNKFILS